MFKSGSRLGAQPFQNFKAVSLRHIKIEQDQIGQGEEVAVSIVAVAVEVGDGGFTVVNDVGLRHIRFTKCALGKSEAVRFVFD